MFLSKLFRKGNKPPTPECNPKRQNLGGTGGTPFSPWACNTLSDDDDDDEGGALRPPVPPEQALARTRTQCGSAVPLDFSPTRRAAGELRRSQTFNEGTTNREPRGVKEVSISSPRTSRSSSGTGSLDDQIRQSYMKIKEVHRGRRAYILKGTDRLSKRPVMIKVYPKQGRPASIQEKVEREQASLRAAAGCNGVVKLLNVIDDKLNTYLVLENVPGVTLIEFISNACGRLPEQRCVVEVVYPLLNTLMTLHSQGIVHRDIKPEHIICSYGNIKLLDFAESAQQGQQCLNCRVGQLEYMAPEVLCKPSAEDIFHEVLYTGMSENELPQYDEKADVWSAGVVIFEALTGCQPFLPESVTELALLQSDITSKFSTNGLPSLCDVPGLSPAACQFLAAILQPDPAARPSAEELLQHPWVIKHTQATGAKWLLPSVGSMDRNRSCDAGDLTRTWGSSNLKPNPLMEGVAAG